MQEVDMAALDKLLGNAKATEVSDKGQLLELELRAIEFWDAHYFANPNPDVNDSSAFKARQARKDVILREVNNKYQTSKGVRPKLGGRLASSESETTN
jgi:hypothetical protein